MCIEQNVDNVDNFVEKYYLQPDRKWDICKKPDKKAINEKTGSERRNTLCQRVVHKKIHMLCGDKRCKSMWIMWITTVKAALRQCLSRLRLPWLYTGRRGYNVPIKISQFRRRTGNSGRPYPELSVPAPDSGS